MFSFLHRSVVLLFNSETKKHVLVFSCFRWFLSGPIQESSLSIFGLYISLLSREGRDRNCLKTHLNISTDQNSFISTALHFLCLLALPSRCFTTAIRSKINSARSYFLDSWGDIFSMTKKGEEQRTLTADLS